MGNRSYGVLSVDPTNGNRSYVSVSGSGQYPDVGTGPDLFDIKGIVVDATGNIFVTDTSNQSEGVFGVDPLTGDRTVVSELNVVGIGPNFSDPEGILLDASGNILVADIPTAAIFSVDPSTGDRIVISVSGVGSGPAFNVPISLVVL